MFPFRRVGGSWEPEEEGLLYLASVGEDGLDLNPIVEALGGHHLTQI